MLLAIQKLFFLIRKEALSISHIKRYIKLCKQYYREPDNDIVEYEEEIIRLKPYQDKHMKLLVKRNLK